ncbi:glucose-6-phosphate 1-dehydrogenase [Pancytospora philotis]|nr:glucose-6-phosphate 1-dehydrogenase [Pancytospora philotis]
MVKLVIFGASGDLTRRKLVPALSEIAVPGLEIIAYARSPLENTYHDMLRESHEYTEEFLSSVRYIAGAYDRLDGLADVLDEDTVCYLSLPPHTYAGILEQLARYKLRAVGVEKPFGTSLEAFSEISQHCKGNVCFIDHYLLKPATLALPRILAGDRGIANVLDRKYVSRVEAYFNESIGIEGRASYDSIGCIKDVIQNHLVVCLAVLLASAQTGAAETRPSTRAEIERCMAIDAARSLCGQYRGYTEEIESSSATETFACLPLAIDTPAWRGVPFVLAGGKALKEKRTAVVFTLRADAHDEILNSLLHKDDAAETKHISGMQLIFSFAPEPEISLIVSADGQEQRHVLVPSAEFKRLVAAHYRGGADYGIVFTGLLTGDAFPHCNNEEIQTLWKLFDPVLGDKRLDFTYEQGVAFPAPAESLVCSLE